MPRIGLIGLGAIGKFYGFNLLRAYGRISVFDSDQPRMKEFRRTGARACKSIKAVVETSDVVILALPSPESVKDVLLGPEGILPHAERGCVILDLSTVDPDTSVQMAWEASKRGVYYLDAPVSGGQPRGPGTEGARNASVTFMVGGNKRAYDKCRPVMEKLGKKFFYLGRSGMGSTVKLLSNLVNGIENLAMAEAFALGAKAGVDPKVLVSVFEETDADSYYLKEYLKPRFLNGNVEPGFSVDLQFKDHRLVSDLAKKLRVPLLLNELALQVYQMAKVGGLGKKDYTAAIPFWGRLAGVDLWDTS